MKYLFYILTIAISLSSCSNTYYYSTLSTNDEGVSRDSTDAFVFETDTLRLTYSFKGEDGPIWISVHNKLDMPMYIDWSRSAIIINDVATNYDGSTSTIKSGKGNFNSSTSYGYEYNPLDVSFIPPMRKVNHCSLELSNLSFGYIDKKEYNNGTIKNRFDQKIRVKESSFTEENTPLFFESYLTIFLEDGSTYVINQSFYIVQLVQTKKVTPSELSQELSQKSNLMFTVLKANNGGWKAVAVGSLIIGTTILDVALSTY